MEEEQGLMFPDWQLPYFVALRTGDAGNTARASGSSGKSDSCPTSRIDKASRARNREIRNKRRLGCSVRNQDRRTRFSQLRATSIHARLSGNPKRGAQLSLCLRYVNFEKEESRCVQ